MAVNSLPTGSNLERLIAVLAQSKVQSTNPALYQVINGLIKQSQQQINLVQGNAETIDNTIVTGGGGIQELTGEVLAGPGTGSQAATINLTAVSWTPVLKFGGGTTGITYGVQSATRVVIDILVLVLGRITLTSKGSSTGAATLTGLPFTVAIQPGVFFMPFFANMASMKAFTGKADVGGTIMGLYQDGATDSLALDDTNFTNTTDFIFGGIFLK